MKLHWTGNAVDTYLGLSVRCGVAKFSSLLPVAGAPPFHVVSETFHGGARFDRIGVDKAASRQLANAWTVRRCAVERFSRAFLRAFQAPDEFLKLCFGLRVVP